MNKKYLVIVAIIVGLALGLLLPPLLQRREGTEPEPEIEWSVVFIYWRRGEGAGMTPVYRLYFSSFEGTVILYERVVYFPLDGTLRDAVDLAPVMVTYIGREGGGTVMREGETFKVDKDGCYCVIVSQGDKKTWILPEEQWLIIKDGIRIR